MSDAPTAAPWEELHEFWDIPYHITQDELRELVKKQTGVVFHTEDSVHRTVGTRTIYLNQVAGMQEYGLSAGRFGLIVNDPEGHGSAYYEGILLIYEEISRGKLKAPGTVKKKTWNRRRVCVR